jgi:hypothetical protein
MIGRFLRLPGRDKTLLLTAALLVFSTRVALWLFPYRTVRERLAQRKVFDGEPYASLRIAWAVSLVSRYIPGATCLTQALAADALLRSHGYTPRLHIGVTKSKSKALEAHAWIELYGDVILGDTGMDRFTPLRAPGGER